MLIICILAGVLVTFGWTVCYVELEPVKKMSNLFIWVNMEHTQHMWSWALCVTSRKSQGEGVGHHTQRGTAVSAHYTCLLVRQLPDYCELLLTGNTQTRTWRPLIVLQRNINTWKLQSTLHKKNKHLNDTTTDILFNVKI